MRHPRSALPLTPRLLLLFGMVTLFAGPWVSVGCGGPSANERKLTLAAIGLDASRELLVKWSEDTQRGLYRTILTRGGSVDEARAAVTAFRAARGAVFEALVLGYGAVRDAWKDPTARAMLNVILAAQRVETTFAALRATAKALEGTP